MSVYKFSPFERFAVYMTHGEKCWACGMPLNLKTMEVDHIIPESMLKKPEELKDTLKGFNLPPHFEINSFSNWLPACRQCNSTKSDQVFNPSPIVQAHIERASRKASSAQRLAKEVISQRKIAKALNVLECLQDEGELDAETVQKLAEVISQERAADRVGQPILLSPLYEILSEQNGLRIVRGRYGIGGMPTIPDPHSSFTCSTCGSLGAWCGARCVICGDMDD